ncbi:MAG: non-homologous end-joining DNA ligase, partial [Fimbriimonadales bacterium]
SYDPNDKHLAVHVEDHPLDYITFEGTIPKGEYGGGEVIVWDEGVYSPDDKGIMSFDDRDEAQRRMRDELKKGKLSVTFRGRKLSGSWTLVKTSGNRQSKIGNPKSEEWLMIKHRDGTEREGYDVLALDRSVRSGRTIEDVAAGRPGNLREPEAIAGAERRKSMPVIKSPMAATEAEKPFNKKGWAFELKIDGIRILAHVDHRDVLLLSRNGNDATMKFPRLVEELKQLPYESFVLDGEVVCYNEDGTPSFQNLIQRFQLQDPMQVASMESKLPIEYCIFDLLFLDGYDLRGATLADRRALLEQMNPKTATMRILDWFPEEGELLFQHATQMGFEGIVGKRLESKYKDGTRSTDWMKVKHHHSDEFIVVGWTAGQGNRSKSFGALVLATREEDGSLRYAGNVGGGFSDDMLDQVMDLLEALPRGKKPFPQAVENEPRVTWVEPKLVVEVRFAQRTREGYLRFPVFLRMRPEWDLDLGAGDRVHGAVGEPRSIDSSQSKVQSPKSKVERPQSEIQNPKAEIEEVLDQLANTKEEFVLEVEGEKVKVSSASKVLWPAAGEFKAVTKRDLLVYLTRVSGFMIRHLEDRPISFVRYPNGILEEGFFQKHWAHRPDFVKRVDIWSNHAVESTEYLMCNNLPTLLWLGQLGSLEIHPWYSRINPKPDTDLPSSFFESDEALDRSVLNYPDFMVVDLDPNIGSASKADGGLNLPNTAAWEKTVEAALPLKELLDSIGLKGYLKTSGKTGLHVYIPIKRVYDYPTVRLMCETIGRHLLQEIPDILTMEWKVAKRPAKVFFDHNQNVRGKTLVSIYSPRPIPGAPVSFPITWQELERGVYPSDFGIENVPELLAERGDLWEDILRHRQSIAGYAD